MNFATTGVGRRRQADLDRGPHRQIDADAVTCKSAIIGVLASGGLDSSILIKCLLDADQRVKPFYILSGLYWQTEE